MKVEKNIVKDQLILGAKSSLDKPAYLQEDKRFKHLLVLGTKGSGKSDILLPALLKQDIENKKVGATVFVSDRESAMMMYSLAKRNNREVRLVKPSLTHAGKSIINMDAYCYRTIQENVIDFEMAIRKKEVVIVDLEFEHNQEASIRGSAFLLTAMREAYLKENEDKSTPHFLYVDDSHIYMSYITPILFSGGEYSIGCTLFLESRGLLTEEQMSYVDAYIRNRVYLSGLTMEDATYVSQEVYEREIMYILNRDAYEFIYMMLDARGKRISGVAKLKPLDADLVDSLRISVPRHRGNVLRSEEETAGKSPAPEEVYTPNPPKQPNSVSNHLAAKVIKTVKQDVKRHIVVLDNIDDEF